MENDIAARFRASHFSTKFKRKYGKTLLELSKSLKVSSAVISKWDRSGFDIYEKAKNINLFRGKSSKKLQHLWQNLKSRCGNPKDISYKRYGGRGILLKLERADIVYLWKRDGADSMEHPSLDRIDSDGHYELNNCRFIENKINGIMALSNWYYKSKGINKVVTPSEVEKRLAS